MIRSNKMMRKALALLLALCVAASLAPCVWADEGPMEDIGEPPIQEGGGSVTLKVSSNDEEIKAELAEATVDVDVYLVATMAGLGNYVPAPGFESLAEQLAAIDLTTTMTALSEAAEALVDETDEEGAALIQPVATFEDLAAVGGVVTFDQNGLYLLAPHATALGIHTYTFNRVLLSIPALGTDEEAENGREAGAPIPDEHLEWQYDYNVFLKPEQSGRYGRIRIEKILQSYLESLEDVTMGPTLFTFLVTVNDPDGNFLYTKLASIEFDGPGTGYAIVDHIPVGSIVTVEEIYPKPGGAYTLVVDGSDQEITIIPVETEGEDGPPTVTFVNTWDDGLNETVYVVNQYTDNGFAYELEQQFGRDD